MSRALIVVDVQNDFTEGGSLAVTGGAAVAAAITSHLGSATYDAVVATRDHHVDPGDHWSDDPDFTTSWPVHCRVGTPGEEFHPSLDQNLLDAVFLKGEYEAAYSGFEGHDGQGATLTQWLREHGIGEVDVCGLATDYCLRATALDAIREGFAARVLTHLSAGVAADTTTAALEELRAAGAQII